jgi:acyl carrier protein phosphodiesterase
MRALNSHERDLAVSTLDLIFDHFGASHAEQARRAIVFAAVAFFNPGGNLR